jgi:hypothetical protein
MKPSHLRCRRQLNWKVIIFAHCPCASTPCSITTYCNSVIQHLYVTWKS